MTSSRTQNQLQECRQLREDISLVEWSRMRSDVTSRHPFQSVKFHELLSNGLQGVAQHCHSHEVVRDASQLGIPSPLDTIVTYKDDSLVTTEKL